MGETFSEWENVKQIFQKVWGYEDLRTTQREIVTSLLQGQDSLAIMATGGGKSICFQLPAILKEGLTLVISPLLALMEDQVRDLQSRNLPAACLHSNLSQIARREVFKNLAHTRLLYISPETLLSQPVWEKLCDRQLKITGIMLDEAHCLVQWGDTFRPSYRRLGAVRQALRSHKPDHHPPIAIAAFTATADREATAELQSCLDLQNPKLVRTSPYRPHLSLNVEIAWTPAGRKAKTLKFISDRQGKSGLIYVRSRRDAEELATWLRQKSLKTAAYHAGLPPQERRQIEQMWLTNQFPFVICTSAFGLGINKPDTRWVLHFHPPLTLSEYIQEIGRAGRDDQPAEALMLVSEPTGLLDDGDRQRANFFLQQQQKLRQQALALLPKLPRQGNFADVAKMYPDAAIALGLLHRAGNLVWRTPFDYEICNLKDSPKDSQKLKLQNGDQRAIAQMQAYIRVKGDRWAFLLNNFGFEEEAKLLLESRN
ncbi:ATP-dependent DNA helicase RecQ [Pseudanabaena sp. FACHB-1998]|uniref:RecQ family ATP-dependent DNA helicase n=1 Tax=Pseudanabaena sp. FACHB-1998 TaxID=2692858 RepID=UPI0016816029|nr:RecQ family ATP-dependent DNA helicase [Pseudanabaena sp. FACHB-1998]MBD2175341.1 ATP-dependent DNA helicase RecQ [Pseudanabaena sp. FACHB-1998]